MNASPQIFISYAREDQHRVEQIYRRLVNAGFQPWLDREHILPGQRWEQVIQQALSRSDFILLCLSSNSINKRGFLQKEIKQALEHADEKLEDDVWLIPARLDDCIVPDSLSHIQWVDLFEEDGWEDLINSIRVGMRQRGELLNTILAEGGLPFDASLVSQQQDAAEEAVKRVLPEGWQAAIERLATLPEQQAAARAAQIELDARLLERCADTLEIGRVHNSLVAGDLAGPASSLLRTFSRLSKDADAALKQESAYNQRLALGNIEDRLDGLLRELTRSSERYAGRFRPIAESWRRIMANQVRESSKAAEERQEIDSPYIIGVPLSMQQELFVGRGDVSSRIEQLLLDRRRPPLLLYGQRRVGKTSLLYNLGRLLPSSIVPLFVDLQGPASAAANHAGLLYNLARRITSSAEKYRNLLLPVLTRESLADDPFTRFDEWLDEIEHALGENTALLALDEFEALDGALREGRFDEASVLGMLRHLIQHRPRFKVMLAGSHMLDELRRWASYLINVQTVKLSYLQEDEARRLVEKPVKEFALSYDPDASQRVLDVTRSHPYLVQLLCAEIVALKNTQDPSIRRRAQLADVERAIPDALAHGTQFFADIERNQIDARGRDLLRALAAKGENGVINQGEATHEFADEAEGALDLLLRRDLIEPINGGYRFQVEMIRRWFVRPSRINPVFKSAESRLEQAIP